MKGLIISGLPASGKGTESKKLAGTYPLLHLDTGEKLRQEVEKESEIGKEAQQYLSKGELVPDALINKMIETLLENQPKEQGVILDGYPRTVQQAAFLEKHPLQLRAMIYLEVEREVLKERMQKRAEETSRKDDKDPKIIRQRIAEQEENLRELRAFYRERNRMYPVDGNGSIEEVFYSIKETIDKNGLLDE